MRQNLDQKCHDDFSQIFNELHNACPRRYEMKSVLLREHACPLQYHEKGSMLGFCSNIQCKANSRKVCDQCMFQRTHLFEPGFDYKQIFFEDQVNQIIELFKDRQIKDIQNSQDLLTKQHDTEDNSQNAYSELQNFNRELEQLSIKVNNLSTQDYIQQVDKINQNIIQYLEESEKELEVIKSKLKQCLRQLNGQENEIEENLVDEQIQNEKDDTEKRSLQDVLKQDFTGPINNEDFDPQEDKKIVEGILEIVLQNVLEQLVKESQTKFQAFITKGICFDEQGKYGEALQLFDEALLFNSDYCQSYFRKGITFNHMRKYEQAIEQYKIALHQQPEMYLIYNKLANVYIKINEYSKANRILERGILMNKNKLFSPEESKSILENLIKNQIFANNSTLFKQLGVICMKLDIPNESQQMIDRAIDIDNNDPLSHKYKGKALIMLGQYEYAQETFEIAEKLGCNPRSLFKYRGIILQEANKLNEAMEILNKYTQYNPFNIKGQLQKGIVYLKQQKYDTAIQQFNKVIELDSNCYLTYQQKGIVLMKQCKFDESLQNVETSQWLEPNNIQSLKLKGILLVKLSRYSDALKICEKVIESDPNHIEIQNCMDKTMKKLTKYQKVADQYSNLIENNPLDLNLYISKGNTLILMQQYYKAIQTFQQAKIIDPKQFELDCSIEYCYYKISQDIDRRINFKDLIQRNIRQLPRLKLYAKSLLSLKEYQFASLIYKIIWQIYPEDEELQFYDKHLKKTEKNYPFKMKQK